MKKKDKPESNGPRTLFVLTPGRTAALGGVLFVFLAMMFFIGTLVGRGDVRINLDQDILAMEIKGLTEAQSDVGTDTITRSLKTQSEFVFYEALKTESAPPRHEPEPAPPAPKVKKRSVVKLKSKPSPIPTPSAATTDDKPPEQPNKPEPPAPEEHNPDIYKYTIQAASLRASEDAEKLARLLKQKGYPAYTIKALVRDNEIWYRVRIGVFKDRMDAKPTLSKLKQDRIDAFLVTRQEKS